MIVICRYKNDDNGISTKWCYQDDSVNNGEFTVCGDAMPDSSLNFEGKEFTDEKKEGRQTCPDCLQRIAYYKRIKY